MNLRVVRAIPTALRNSGGYTETAAESPFRGGGNSLTVTVRVAGTVAWPGRRNKYLTISYSRLARAKAIKPEESDCTRLFCHAAHAQEVCHNSFIL